VKKLYQYVYMIAKKIMAEMGGKIKEFSGIQQEFVLIYVKY